MEVVGEVDYRIAMDNGKVKTYHINMLKRYFHRDEIKPDKVSNERDVDKPDQVHQAASDVYKRQNLRSQSANSNDTTEENMDE